jgi:hypothetical protein
MTAPVVQTASNAATGATVAASFDTAPTAGNTVLAIVNSNNVFTVDGGGTRRYQYLSDQQFDIWEYTGTLPQTVTVTPGAADYVAITLLELTDVTALDLVGSGSAIAGDIVSATATTITTTSSDLVLAAVALHGASGGTVPTDPVWGNGFAAAASTPMPPTAGGQSAACGQWIGSKSEAAAGAVGATTVTWTNAAENADTVLIAYKASADEEPPPAETGIYIRQSGAWVPGVMYLRTAGTWVEVNPTA